MQKKAKKVIAPVKRVRELNLERKLLKKMVEAILLRASEDYDMKESAIEDVLGGDISREIIEPWLDKLGFELRLLGRERPFKA